MTITVESVTKAFDGHSALAKLDLEIRMIRFQRGERTPTV